MRSPAYDTSSQDHSQEDSSQEAVLPGLAGGKRTLPKTGGSPACVIARGYVSRGGAKCNRHATTPTTLRHKGTFIP
jgi:hypothetical protein